MCTQNEGKEGPLSKEDSRKLEIGDMSIVKEFFPEHNEEDLCPFIGGYIYKVCAFRIRRTKWLYWGKEFGKKL